MISNDDEERDENVIAFGLRVDQFNQTYVNQQGNLCGSVLEVCCNVDLGTDHFYISFKQFITNDQK